MDTRWRTAWITGASSGIGRALAIALTRNGVKVAASARSADALAEFARAYPGVAPLPLDVTDATAMMEGARSISGTLGPLDLAVFGAGIWLPMSARNFSAAKGAHSMAVNYQGVVNGIQSIIYETFEQLDFNAVERAAESIAKSSFVLSFGSGGASSMMAGEIETRLFRLGLKVASTDDHQLQLMRVAAAPAGTVIGAAR